MLRIATVLLILFSLSFNSYATIVNSGDRKWVPLSNNNPNRVACLNGNINQIIVPQQIPHDLQITRENAFITYKMRRKGEDIEYVTISHDIIIVCDAEVYTLNVSPRNRGSKSVKLGNPKSAEIAANAKKLQEMSIEDIMSEMFIDAYNNDLPPNYTVQKSSRTIPINSNIKAEAVRDISLNGVGLKIKEYKVITTSKISLDKRMFITKSLSKSLRAVALVPEIASPNKPARLFIIEDK